MIADIRNYNIPINHEQPIELFADGLCENPGAMHIGLFARQGSTCLFTRHMFAGHGTCNEAEYIAVKTGLAILQALYPEPGVSLIVFCDSQLVTKQVNGLWKSSGKMQDYCIFLRRLRKVYPYTLQKIPRSENEMADGGPKYISKTPGVAWRWRLGASMSSSRCLPRFGAPILTTPSPASNSANIWVNTTCMRRCGACSGGQRRSY